MHICHVALDYPSATGGGGVGTQVRTLSQALVAAGHRVTVIALPEAGEAKVQDDNGISVRRMKRGNIHWYVSKLPLLGPMLALPIRELEYGWWACAEVRRLHAEIPIDVIEGIETGSFFVRCRGLAPLVIRLHGEEYTFRKYTPGLPLTVAVRLSRMLQRVALRRASLLISPSRAHANEIGAELGRGAPPIEIVPNSLPRSVDAQPLNGHAGDTPDFQTVLYVGRLERRKGVPEFIDAAKRIHEQAPATRFLMAGNTHATLPESELRSRLAASGLNGQIQVLGHVGRERLAEYYQQAAVCVLPSYYETFGFAALEGMAAGAAVVATTAGALPEVIEDGVSGLLVPPGDSEALAGAIMRLLHDGELRSRLGSAARTVARANFGVDRQVGVSTKLYQWAVASNINMTAGIPDAADVEHVFFSPHLDDVAISCGGLIDSLTGSRQRVSVVTVFAGKPDPAGVSAFARHLHAKWGLTDDVLAVRKQEDLRAMAALRVERTEHWDLLDAPYRLGADGQPVYSSYDELAAEPAERDAPLRAGLLHKMEERLGRDTSATVVYFPLALSWHVDHKIVASVGLRLAAKGYTVRFYEEWPYTEYYRRDPSIGWACHSEPVSLTRKIEAAQCYASQAGGLGGSIRAIANKLRKSARSTGNGTPRENYWEILPVGLTRMAEGGPPPHIPFTKKVAGLSIRSLRRVASAFRWHDLDEVLPGGSGLCVDMGCGSGRHKGLVTSKGYQWIGVDLDAGKVTNCRVRADVSVLPVASGSAAAAVAWQVMEYVDPPEQIVAEAARILASGGVFCGSVSFLEPLHGMSYYNLSPLVLKRLLTRHGFADIGIRPGLFGVSLQAWTILGRYGGRRLAGLGLPLTAAFVMPLLALRFLASWALLRLGLGGGHGMRWVVEDAPLEFAGHVMFSARKKESTKACI